MPIKTIQWNRTEIKIIDQTKLPKRLEFIHCRTITGLWKAIRSMKIRGAPALGIAGAYGVILGLKDSTAKAGSRGRERAKGSAQLLKHLQEVIEYLGSSRPTAVNLFWALERMQAVAVANRHLGVKATKKRLLDEAKKIEREDKDATRKMARFGATLIKDGDTILTHCNAGALATAGYGTALGVIYMAKKQGKRVKVYADETRPLLQGARLTTWELMREGIDVTLICDNMAASIMKAGVIDKVVVGADRIAANGDTANKIGTYNLAALADYHRIPFYVVAPTSTIDFKIRHGSQIPIEQRDASEVKRFSGIQTAPCNVKVYNPAFDVTPHRLITAIVTENGICRPPFKERLRRLNKVTKVTIKSNYENYKRFR